MGQVTDLAADGKLAWNVKLPAGSPPSLGPLITSDGTRVVVTNAGDLVGITAAGRTKFTSSLAAGRWRRFRAALGRVRWRHRARSNR